MIEVHEIDQGEVLDRNGLSVTAFDVEHFPVEQPFGFRFDTKDRRIAVSGDTCPCDNLIRHAHKVDLLVHECTEDATWPDPRINHEITGRSHTGPDKLGLVAAEASPGLLVTTHMNPDSIPRVTRERISRDFRGPIVVGEDLMTA